MYGVEVSSRLATKYTPLCTSSHHTCEHPRRLIVRTHAHSSLHPTHRTHASTHGRKQRSEKARHTDILFKSRLLFHSKESATRPRSTPNDVTVMEGGDNGFLSNGLGKVKSLVFSPYGRFLAKVQKNSVILEEVHLRLNRCAFVCTCVYMFMLAGMRGRACARARRCTR